MDVKIKILCCEGRKNCSSTMPRRRILVAALQDEAEGRVMVVVVVVVVVKGKRYYEDGLAGVKGEERWSTT